MKILLVDDHELLLDALKALLEHKLDAEVITTTDPLKAIAIADGADLVICDFGMAPIDGIQVWERMGRPKNFLLLTGEARLDDVPCGLEVVLKGGDSKALLEAIKRVLAVST
jgi:DNA-binding NarL/FixJ family response regulator